MTDATVPATAQSRELSPQDAFRRDLTRMEGEFAAALPDQIPAARFVRTVITSVQMNPDLLQTDRRSLYGACMKAAQDGLLPDGRESALVIFRNKNGAPLTQYMPMIGGLLKKLRNSGELSRISAHVVYENDMFSYRLGDSESIDHLPILTDRGKPIAVYAIAQTRDGSIWREVMSVLDVEKVRSVSRAKDNGPWVQWWDEMARKTVLRRLCKRLPSSADIDQLLAHDDETYELDRHPERNVTPPVAPGQQLREMIGAGDGPAGNHEPPRTRRGRPPKNAEQPSGNGVTVTRNDTGNTKPHDAPPAPKPTEAELIRQEIAFRLERAPESFEWPLDLAGWQTSEDTRLLHAALDCLNGAI